ncbi:hypothetical protein MRB53_021054 [Persea americana]|uniref:Uncharacterized protein n=1 Tax=Persea americana TaxID=3435 RepID=A0ACC2L2M8_PERAE|nr:hypothetical protein MRB53_021054 [Persea americana]
MESRTFCRETRGNSDGNKRWSDIEGVGEGGTVGGGDDGEPPLPQLRPQYTKPELEPDRALPKEEAVDPFLSTSLDASKAVELKSETDC